MEVLRRRAGFDFHWETLLVMDASQVPGGGGDSEAGSLITGCWNKTVSSYGWLLHKEDWLHE